MEMDIITYTSGYVAARLAVLLGLGFALYQVSIGRHVRDRQAVRAYRSDSRRADAVREDRC